MFQKKDDLRKSTNLQARGTEENGFQIGGEIVLWGSGSTNVIKCSLGTEDLSLNVFLVSFCPAFSSLLLPFNVCFVIVVLFLNNYHDLSFIMRAKRILL